MPATSVRAGTSIPAFTNAIAATKADSPMTAPSMTTAFMPTSALRLTMQPCRTAPWPICASSSMTVSVPGKPWTTQLSCRLPPPCMTRRPKSPRSEAPGPM